jgi:hypothetical protein
MENFDSWAWIIVVVFVFVTRFLPRLFRKMKGEAESPQPRQPSPPKPVQEGTGTGVDLETLVKSLSRPQPATDRTASPPPPIEPK